MPASFEAGAFEAQGISGVGLAAGATVMGIRLACPHPALGLFDGADVLHTLEAPEHAAPEAGYVRYSWRVPVTPAGIQRYATWPRRSVNAPDICAFLPGEAVRVTLEWCVTAHGVVGRYTVDGAIAAGLIANGCFKPAEVRAAETTGCELRQDGHQLLVQLHGAVTSPHRLATREHAELAHHGLPYPPGTALAYLPVNLSPETPLYFTLRLTDEAEEIPTSPAIIPDDIDRQLRQAANAYETTRMRGAGLCAGVPEAVAGLAGYGRAYDPARGRVQTTVNRTWSGMNSPGVIFGWDNFFTSYSAAWEDPALGAASLEHVVGMYAERGIAHGPTQRNLIIPVMYCRTLDILGDDALAARTWPTMMAFMRFWFGDRGDGRPWRDGNGDGLIESGASAEPGSMSPGRLISEAMDETGYDDIPIYSAGFTNDRRGLLAENVEFDWPSRTLTITQVGQNSLYCAACRAMARWAERLGHRDDAAWLHAEEARVAGRMKELLYCADDGIFRDRYWSGGFSPVKTMTLFYPLLAGITDAATAKRLQAMLLDPAQFWGENLIPTVSRDDPAYCDGLDRRGNYWRGNCWPPTTYIVYLAIKEAGWDALAAEYARRTVGQFMEYWQAYGHAYENYPPEGKVDHDFLYVSGWGGREIRYTWSSMMLFCGLEEVFGPEVLRPGIHFGNPALPELTAWRQFRYAGETVDAVAGPIRTEVKFGARWALLAEPGIAVRAFHQDAHGYRFTASPIEPVTVRLNAADLQTNSAVRCNGEILPANRNAEGVTFTLPVGACDVVIEGRISR